MNKKLLLIDVSPQKKTSLTKYLERYFSVTRADLSTYKKNLTGSTPDLVLVRIGDDSPVKADIVKTLGAISRDSSVPVVVLSSIDDVAFYINCLNAGIAHYIKSPASKNFLVTKIAGILQKRVDFSDGDKLHDLSFAIDGNQYAFSLKGEKLISFLISMIDNTQHQARLVQDFMKKKYPLAKYSSDADILESPGVFTPDETIMAEELALSFERGDFRLFFQPVVSLADGHVSGFESLIRWEHPERGIVPPDQFIPIIEKTPLIGPIGFWIVEEAARQVRKWYDEFSFEKPLRINVNLSAKQFVLDELCDRISDIIEEYRVQPESLAFEITESAFMDDMENANLMLLKLKAAKHRIYMDDFGTGYSSLSYLRHFPVDTLKIDKSFVEWMHIDEQSEQIVRAVIDLAHNLKMTVVAEGVELEEHREALRKYGCDYGQGYLFSKPLDVPAARLYLQKMRAAKLV